MNATNKINPADIDTDRCRHFWGCFGDHDSEVSARWIVRMFRQKQENFRPFTVEEINAFYNADQERGECGFDRLIDKGWLSVDPETNKIHCTESFVIACYDASIKYQKGNQQNNELCTKTPEITRIKP